MLHHPLHRKKKDTQPTTTLLPLPKLQLLTPVSEKRKVLLSFFSIPLLGGLIYFSHTLLVLFL